jgi:competence protein ComEA
LPIVEPTTAVHDVDSDDPLDDDERDGQDDDYDGHDGQDEGDVTVVRPRRVGRTWGRFAELWVPEAVRDARVDPGRRGALMLLLVAALAAVATAVGVWRDRPEPRPIETTSLAQVGVSTISESSNAVPLDSVAASPDPVAMSQADGSSEQGEIVVSVTGLVANPGVVRLPPRSRVADAIAAAGGTTGEADVTGLNLAARLLDGDSVVIGDSAAAGGAGADGSGTGSGGTASGAGPNGGAAGAGLINLNTADEAALDTLPGVGPVMAQNIVAWREANGKFTSVEQLQEISGIGPSRYAQISPLVTVS